MIFTDSHAHLTQDVFDSDREAVLERARGAGMRYVCVIASLARDVEPAVALSIKHDFIYCAVGLHPHDAKLWDGESARRIESLARHPWLVAIGEIGLDYHYDHSPRDRQQEVFREQVRVARHLGLPLVIHTREAHDDTLRILEEEKASEVAGVFHCFSGNQEMAEFALRRGFHVSFSGMITFKNAGTLRDLAARVPVDRLLSETDAPFLSPHPYRGRRNEPLRTLEVVAQLAGLHGVTPEEMGEKTTKNFEAVFPRVRNRPKRSSPSDRFN